MTDIYQALTKMDEQLARAIVASQSNTDELLSMRTLVTVLRESAKPKPLPELAVSIVDNSDYGDTLKAAMRGYIDVIAASDVRRVLMFQNYPQMVTDKFPQYAIDKGLQVDFDTMWSVRRTCDDKKFAAYMTQAEKFKPQGYHFDDAHNNLPEALEPAVKFMRQFTDAPIYASHAADDSRLPVRKVKNPVTGKEELVRVTMQEYVNAGLKITRQFFRHDQVKKSPANPTGVIDTWLKSGRILDGVNLEAYKVGAVTTSPKDFEAMLLKCLNAGQEFLSVYAVVNSPKWQMWKAAPELWQAVQAGAVTVRLWKQ